MTTGGRCNSRAYFFWFLFVGGLYSVTVLRENDQERVTVYTKHQLKLHSQTTRKRRRPEEFRHPRGRWPDRRDRPARWGERGGAGGCAPSRAPAGRQPAPLPGRWRRVCAKSIVLGGVPNGTDRRRVFVLNVWEIHYCMPARLAFQLQLEQQGCREPLAHTDGRRRVGR